ncbi:UDP-N-acetylglucosamine 2-epimerase (non-hydrolyzing) [Streptosporangiaceae bacterium NEAU-GS5]|nr:UDP-N-acetylglucosamine 2-epimerase (non-hydrolyzing) [Streptosporangiaceae bacterium NEAU-GS5]
MIRRVCVVVGTRPEAIKLGVVVQALRERPWAHVDVLATGQHGSVVEEVLTTFGCSVTRRVATERGEGGLSLLTADLIAGLGREFQRTAPDLVVVQGDTTSALAGAVAGYLDGIPVAHVEAGLRSYDRLPFPEEANRRLIAPLAALHLAPTVSARDNLLAERVPGDGVVVSGNTVVDALLRIAREDGPRRSRHLVLVTAHRRESWGEPLRQVARVVNRLARAYGQVEFLVATHMNPAVRAVFEREAEGLPNVRCAPPLPYVRFARLLTTATMVITDSGGIQEEAAALRLPLLVMRETTERRDGLSDPSTHLVGTDDALIFKTASAVLDRVGEPEPRVPGPCVYGDGRAAERTAAACGWLLGLEDRPRDFVWPAGRSLAGVSATRRQT